MIILLINWSKWVDLGQNPIVSLNYTTKEEQIVKVIGKSSHQLDERNRFRVPIKFKPFFSENEPLYICPGRELKCLYILTEDKFDALISQLDVGFYGNTEIADVRTFIMSNSQQVEIDNQGRVTLDINLVNLANIKKNISTIGMGDYIEIWSEDDRNKIDEGISKDNNFAEVLRKLENLGK